MPGLPKNKCSERESNDSKISILQLCVHKLQRRKDLVNIFFFLLLFVFVFFLRVGDLGSQ
jgi:hypothetical protein